MWKSLKYSRPKIGDEVRLKKDGQMFTGKLRLSGLFTFTECNKQFVIPEFWDYLKTIKP